MRPMKPFSKTKFESFLNYFLPKPKKEQFQPPTFLDFLLEYTGAGFAVFGVLIIALNVPFSSWGWVLALLSNLLLIPFTWRRDLKGFFGMQLCFLGINLVGLIRHFHDLVLIF